MILNGVLYVSIPNGSNRPQELTFMSRLQTILMLITLANTLSQAQQPNRSHSLPNDPDPTRWIQYDQSYYKIPIAQNGLYHITTAELQRAGVPIAQIDPTTVQLFRRGIEQAIYLAGEADHQFDPEDFLEFYGERNDGTSDSLLYRPNQAQPHPYYNLFNDTTAYFLTWNRNGLSGKRMIVSTDTISAGLTPETYHWADELRLFTDTYPGWAAGLLHTVEYSYYEAGEGYTGVIQSAGKPYTLSFQLVNPFLTGPAPQIDLLVVGRSYGNHRLAYSVGSTLISQKLVNSVHFMGYVNARMQPRLNWSDVGSDGRIYLSTVSQAGAVDDYSVSYVRFQYPQALVSTGQTVQRFNLKPNPIGRSLVVISNLALGTRFWDISDPTTARQIISTRPSTDQVKLVVTGTETARTILAVSQPQTVPAIRPITFTDWRNRKPTYLIISHEALMKPIDAIGSTPTQAVNAVQAYAEYRASPAGGNHDTLTVTMQQLFDQYSYGERHPLAVRRFARQMLQQSRDAPPYLFLLGRGRSTPGIRHNPQQVNLDLVMTAGFPGSDVPFTAALIEDELDIPALPTGRINAATPQDVLAYLAKVREYESTITNAPWRKNWLHLSGGQTPDEQDLFRRIVDSYRDQTVGSPLGAQVTTISKTTDQLAESLNLAKLVNEGVGLITFFGHSGLDITDLNIGFCSNDTLGYQNKGKYPLLLMNGCALGNVFYGRPTLAADWVLTPNRGAIAAIAQSHIGHVDVLNTYTTLFYSLLTDSTQRTKSLGQLQQETIRRVLVQNPGGRTLANAQQLVLQGDPAIRLFPGKTPDDTVNTDSLLTEHALVDFTVSPNPCLDQAIFTLTIAEVQRPVIVTIILTDLNGHVVYRLGSPAYAGRNEWVWDGRSDTGLLLPAGVYLYTVMMTDDPTGPVANPISKRLTGRLVLLR